MLDYISFSYDHPVVSNFTLVPSGTVGVHVTKMVLQRCRAGMHICSFQAFSFCNLCISRMSLSPQHLRTPLYKCHCTHVVLKLNG